MRRLAATVALSALTMLALPLPSASACSPARPFLTLDKATVPQGGTLRVAGDQTDKPFVCDMTPPGPTPTPEPTEPSETQTTSGGPIGPSEEPSAEPSQSVEPETPAPTTTAPAPVPLAMVPVAYGENVPLLPAVITIGTPEAGYHGDLAPGSITLGTASYTKDPIGEGYFDYRLSTTVKIPSDLAPGPYIVHASIPNRVFFGAGEVTVVAALPDTGTDVTAAVRLAALLLLVGAGALALDRARAKAQP